jgi:hypothetical protein
MGGVANPTEYPCPDLLGVDSPFRRIYSVPDTVGKPGRRMRMASGERPVLDYDDILERYLEFRQASKALNSRLTGLLAGKAILTGAKKLGMLGRKNTLVLDGEEEFAVLTDFSIHSVLDRGKNIAERLLESPPDDFTPGETGLLSLFAQSRYTLFGIEDVEPGVGVHAVDILSESDHVFIADLGFSETGDMGALFAGRLIPLGGFFATGGAVLPVRLDLIPRIIDIVAEAVSAAKAEKFSDLPRKHEAEYSGAIIRLLLKSGASSDIAYAGSDLEADDFFVGHAGDGYGFDEGSTDPLGPPKTKIGRNEPCPCGSGLKYKRCCGGQ